MENTNTKNLRHLYDLTHAVPEVPELGSIYTSKLHKTFNKKNLTLPNQITNGAKFCSGCETLLIPGINLSMRIVYSKCKKSDKNKTKAKVWKPRERKLRFTCLSCNNKSHFDLLEPESDPTSMDTTPTIEEKKPFVATWKPTEEKKKSSAKERAKKRKKNNLSLLLNNKKEREEQEKKKSSLLSLNDFMKG